MSIRTLLCLPSILLVLGLFAQPGGGPINQTDPQGRKQGPWVRMWAESDQVRYTGQFKDGKAVGHFIYYSTKGKEESRIDHYPGSNASHGRHFHPNGQLMAEGRYVGTEKDSTWNYYDTEGILRSTEQWDAGKMHGTMISYFADGQVAERRNFKDGKGVGLAEQFYPDGTLRYHAIYVNGVPEGMETFYFPNGNKEIEGKYVNGNRDGRWVYYNEDGSWKMQVAYAQGEMQRRKYENGTFKEYWVDEQVKSEYTYKQGKREGPFTEWYDNGTWTEVPMKLGPERNAVPQVERELKGQTKKREGAFHNDVLHGTVKEYDESGKLISTVVYDNGVAATGGMPEGTR